MIRIIRHIKEVELTCGNKKLISSLPHFNTSAESYILEIPCEIKFNEAWTITHQSDEVHQVSFSENNNLNWNIISRLFSRFYETDLLKIFADRFESLKLFESSKSKFSFLTREDFNDMNANIFSIPQVKFNYYNCELSGQEFLCRFAQGAPIFPDPRFPKGKEGLLKIYEIVQIEVDGPLTFIELLEKYKKEV